MDRKTTLIALSAVVVIAALVGVKLLLTPAPRAVTAEEPPEVLRLPGVVRDFRDDHPDFGITSSGDEGHCVENVEETLGASSRPVYGGGGRGVEEQWYDKDGNPIRPYLPPADDPGLPGGHFDVDVFDEATDKQEYHKHEFDDAFDVTYIDVANDPKLLYAEILGGAPQMLRLEFINPHHGVGTYTFKAGGPLQSGPSHEGFTAEFNSAALAQLKVEFESLNDMRHTSPGNVQGDVIDRDDAFAIRMYNRDTDVLVYEIAAYHHGKAEDIKQGEEGSTYKSEDSCGNPIEDEIGKYDDPCSGAVTGAESFGQWYSNALGVNLSGIHTIELTRNAAGVYEYLTNAFYPIDDELFGNEGLAHNHLFTYMIPATFTYDACAGQFFEFEGNDDAWVFIDNGLAIDLGGLATPQRQYIALDRLGLEDGQEYTFHFFFAHRRVVTDSVFRMRTNIELQGTIKLPTSGTYD